MQINIADLKKLGNKVIICNEIELLYNVEQINIYMNKEVGRTTSVYINNIKTVASKYSGTLINENITLTVTNDYILILEITEV